MKLLVVEDDTGLAADLRERLNGMGYAVELASNGIDGEFLGDEEDFDGILLDLGLPGKSGLDVLRHWRARGNATPVVILTARDAWHERVDGLRAGADDYLGKPFHIEELQARLEAVLRRRHGRADNIIAAAGLRLDGDHQQAFDRAGNPHQLTAIEFRLLRYLMVNPGKVLSKRELSEHIYEDEHLRDSNVIEVYINRLRQRFGKDLIETRRGQGYCLREAL